VLNKLRKAVTTNSVDSTSLAFESVDAHPQVQRHARERDALEEQLRRITTRVAQLVDEHTRVRRVQHEQRVSALLGDGVASESDVVTTVTDTAELDSALSAARADEAAVQDALERHRTIAVSAREQLEMERRQQIAQAAMDMLRTMLSMAEELTAQNHQLVALASRAQGVLVPSPGVLELWLSQARGVLGEQR
jgi:hypothetical protein